MTPGPDRPAHSPPPGAAALNLLGVDYAHLRTGDGGDLYLTKFGVPFLEHLRPENWFERPWFEQNREKQEGTGTVYRVRTKPVGGRGKDIVVKWCRVGEEVPFDTFTFTKFAEAEFNSPYEEFALVMEMRAQPSPALVRTHKPLAIFVPAKKLKPWQTGRSTSKIEQKKAKYRDVELDICRQYILIYEWVKGLSASEVFPALIPDVERRKREAARLTERGIEELRRKGFRMLDIKPDHFIVRPRADGTVLRNRDGEIAYALIDFELLERTPEREQEVTASRRAAYLRHQKDRFVPPGGALPAHLRPMRILDVDYVHGHSESTQGELWVVGRDPALFDYFLPERWRRTERRRLSQTNEVYHTKTKDNIHLVWKVSRVGEMPEAGAGDARGKRILDHGYNSPFEEFALALELGRLGFPATYPRAVYRTGQEADAPDYTADSRRYETHQAFRMPDGTPILRPEHNFITVWGYWNGLDEVLARQDVPTCKPVNLAQARADGRVTGAQFNELMDRANAQLAQAGFEDLNPEGTHWLLSLDSDHRLIAGPDGTPTLRLCNFGLVRKRAGAAGPA